MLNLPKRKLVRNDQQALTESAQVPRSQFTADKVRLTAFTGGDLVPIHCQEILPGDHMRYEIIPHIRMGTLLWPIMSEQTVDTHWFFVPNRLVWENWPRFMGEQKDPAQSIDVAYPYKTLDATAIGINTLYDHMYGIKPGTYATLKISALPARAYRLIWNTWFRDQDLQDSQTVTTSDGSDSANFSTLLKRNKFHDYFTSARPWSQKFASPMLPLSGMADVYGIGSTASAYAGAVSVTDTNLGAASYSLSYRSNVEGIVARAGLPQSGANVYADLSSATGISINTFRQAIMLQSLLEKDAVGGTRYVELLWKHFRVRNPDFRLQRPEYIGGGSSKLNVQPVAQTAPTTGAPVGTLGAAATVAGQHSASYAATEHGWIIGLISVRSELTYQQGLHKQFTRWTRYDHYWPSTAMLGEQGILNSEIYLQGTSADNNVFGYQERWHELRTLNSDATGLMRSGVAGTLDAWHLGESFNSLPTLGNTFVREQTAPITRALAAGSAADNQQYIGNIYIRATMTRPVPMFGTPASLGRF